MDETVDDNRTETISILSSIVNGQLGYHHNCELNTQTAKTSTQTHSTTQVLTASWRHINLKNKQQTGFGDSI